QPPPLLDPYRQRIRTAQIPHDRTPPIAVAGRTAERHALIKDLDGVCQVSLSEVELAQAPMHHDRGDAAAFQPGEAEGLLPVAPALREGPERTQDPGQPGPGPDSKVGIGRARLPV